MSFLDELKKQKEKLKLAETVVTQADGQRHVERLNQTGFQISACPPNQYGFVVDTKPDDIPCLVIHSLYIGSQDCAVTEILDKFQIKNIVSLGIKMELASYNNVYIECLDLPETDIKPILNSSLGFIKKAVDLKENVLIHCNAGVSRTSMVAIGYLMYYENYSYLDAYDLLKGKRPAIQPNAGFVRQLKLLKYSDLVVEI